MQGEWPKGGTEVQAVAMHTMPHPCMPHVPPASKQKPGHRCHCSQQAMQACCRHSGTQCTPTRLQQNPGHGAPCLPSQVCSRESELGGPGLVPHRLPLRGAQHMQAGQAGQQHMPRSLAAHIMHPASKQKPGHRCHCSQQAMQACCRHSGT
jgi:hypothetical protein